MLRYWFRVFALGVLQTSEVKRWEANLFGAINPQTRGWVSVQIFAGQVVQPEARPTLQGKNDPCGEQTGILALSYSSEVPPVIIGKLIIEKAAEIDKVYLIGTDQNQEIREREKDTLYACELIKFWLEFHYQISVEIILLGTVTTINSKCRTAPS